MRCRFFVLTMALLWIADTAQAQLFGRPDRGDRFGDTIASGDFDGDGYDDIAIGVEQETNQGVNLVYAGQVHVIYGSDDGFDPWRQQLWNLTTMNVHPFDQGQLVGRGLETGDFNSDGYDDLAIGAHGFAETPNGFAGVVYILYGNEEGLTNRELQTWYEDRSDLDRAPSGADFFGYELIAGDFNGDDFDDLVIGSPNKFGEMGQILILRGSDDGLTAEAHQYIDEPASPAGVGDGPGAWGFVMDSGDVNGDGFDELVVGMWAKEVDDHSKAGVVGVIYGGPNGLTLLGYDLIRQGHEGVPDAPEPEDAFGWSVLVTDFGDDGFAELMIGAPTEDKTHDSISGDGAVFGLFGSAGGLSPERRYVLWVDGVPLQGASQTGDLFGFAMAAGDFDGDGDADFAVGEPGDNTAGGAVHVVFSSGGTITVVGNTFWTMATEGVEGSGVDDAEFGNTLATGDFNGDNFDDLAIGAPDDVVAGIESAGSVNVLYGSEAGITSAGSQYLHQNLPPGEFDITSPSDGSVVNVGGTDAPIDSETPFIILWTPAEDPEGVPIDYYWQVSSQPDFSDTLTTVRVGFLNQFVTTLGFLGELMRDNGVEHEATVTWHHRIIAWDRVDRSVTPAVAITLTRGSFVSSEGDEQPYRAALFGNHPNPFKDATTIRFQTSTGGDVLLEVFDVGGRRVGSFESQITGPGPHDIDLPRGDLSPGVYIYRIRGGGLVDSGRMVVVD